MIFTSMVFLLILRRSGCLQDTGVSQGCEQCVEFFHCGGGSSIIHGSGHFYTAKCASSSRRESIGRASGSLRAGIPFISLSPCCSSVTLITLSAFQVFERKRKHLRGVRARCRYSHGWGASISVYCSGRRSKSSCSTGGTGSPRCTIFPGGAGRSLGAYLLILHALFELVHLFGSNHIAGLPFGGCISHEITPHQFLRNRLSPCRSPQIPQGALFPQDFGDDEGVLSAGNKHGTAGYGQLTRGLFGPVPRHTTAHVGGPLTGGLLNLSDSAIQPTASGGGGHADAVGGNIGGLLAGGLVDVGSVIGDEVHQTATDIELTEAGSTLGQFHRLDVAHFETPNIQQLLDNRVCQQSIGSIRSQDYVSSGVASSGEHKDHLMEVCQLIRGRTVPLNAGGVGGRIARPLVKFHVVLDVLGIIAVLIRILLESIAVVENALRGDVFFPIGNHPVEVLQVLEQDLCLTLGRGAVGKQVLAESLLIQIVDSEGSAGGHQGRGHAVSGVPFSFDHDVALARQDYGGEAVTYGILELNQHLLGGEHIPRRGGKISVTQEGGDRGHLADCRQHGFSLVNVKCHCFCLLFQSSASGSIRVTAFSM
nr:MAG TPA: hypothetical protein [Caudoviricetes sp.]